MDIISSPDTKIHKKLVENYGQDFIKKLCDVISKSYKNDKISHIFSIISTLISSQTDADRMDYLLRDSYFTKVSNGVYDIDRLIKSFGVEEIDGELKIYVNEKYMSTLEEYVLARYFMHKEVYQHTTKKHFEDILIMIFKRAKELLEKDKHCIYCDEILRNIYLNGSIKVEQYLQTDDNYFNYHILKWSRCEDKILSFLSNCFLNRGKFDVEIRNSKVPKNIQEKFDKLGIKDIENEYFYSKSVRESNIYVGGKNSILIKKSNTGELCDITQVSLLINDFNKNKMFVDEKLFLSSTLFKYIYNEDLI